MSDLDNEELEATRIKTVRQAYDTVYTEMCRYMELYNKAEERIKELEEENKKLKSDNYNLDRENAKLFDRTIDLERIIDKTKVDLDKYEITIPLDNTGLEDIEYYYKKGDKWYAHYKEIKAPKELEEQAKSKVTEKELKDMILGMLE